MQTIDITKAHATAQDRCVVGVAASLGAHVVLAPDTHVAPRTALPAHTQSAERGARLWTNSAGELCISPAAKASVDSDATRERYRARLAELLAKNVKCRTT